MCGIAGLIGLNQPVHQEELLAMADVVRHRGPDDEGYMLATQDGRCHAIGGKDTPANVRETHLPYSPQGQFSTQPFSLGLAHRRLAIVDLSATGHQPMCTTDRRYWIVYNGEVYNHVELRSELESLGCRFISTSDTEVILQAYRYWGSSCLQRFNGMFAFLIVDVQERRLFAARDRFGVKPLYLWRSPKGFLAFASEIKQFTVLPGWQARMNRQRVYDFLVWGLSNQTSETLFDGVCQLRGGEALDVEIDSLVTDADPGSHRAPWYRLMPTEFSGSFDDATKHYLELFHDAVRIRLRSDVPVGSCLSGGIDSSSIVCMVKELLCANEHHPSQKTFSAFTPVGRLDERSFVAAVVQRTGVESYSVQPTLDGLLESLDELIWQQDEPIGSSSMYAQWCVFKLARENGVKVMLDGQGADECLAGYHAFFGPRLASLIRSLSVTALRNEMEAMSRLHGYSAWMSLKFAAASLLNDSSMGRLRFLAGATDRAPAWLDLKRLDVVPANPFAQGSQRWRGSIKALSHSQITRTNLNMLLHWEDRNSMANSIEARVPFLDYRLVEFAVGLPDEYKLENGVTKRVLRSAMRGILPDMIADRMDKIGFETPEGSWLHESPMVFTNLLQQAVSFSDGVLSLNAETLMNHLVTRRGNPSYLIMRLITFGIWAKRFSVTAS